MSTQRLPVHARLTALLRTVDLRRPSNRFALVAAAGTLVISAAARLVWAEEGLAAAARGGAVDGAGIFLAWSLARELDPDRTSSARYAALLAAALLLLGTPALLPVAATLVAARIMLRPTGLAPRPLDLAAVVVLSTWAATARSGLVPALALAAALALDARGDDDRDARVAYTAAFVALMAAVPAAILAGEWVSWRVPDPMELVIVAVTALAALRLRTDPPRTRCDHGPYRLDPGRLLGARRTVGVILLLALLWSGADAVGALGPAWAALLGTAAGQRLARRPEPA